CPNRPGIVAAVSTYLFKGGCNILDAQQFDDTQTNMFFMRVVFNPVNGDGDLEALRDGFTAIAKPFDMNWTMRDQAQRTRVMLLASNFDHCLADLLYHCQTGELNVDITGIVSNHARETYSHLEFRDIPFHHLPVTKDTKLDQEMALVSLIKESG